jgi:hypothetical protein
MRRGNRRLKQSIRMCGLATKSLLAILIVLAGCSLVFGQAGSVGGVVGKTDKSLSGGGVAPETQAEPRSKGERHTDGHKSDQPSGSSVSGRWHWSADCTLGHYQAEFDLAQTSPGNFNGHFVGDVGTIADGHISGTRLSFTQTNVNHYWKGQLAAGHMKGTISGSGVHYANCSWEASKE